MKKAQEWFHTTFTSFFISIFIYHDLSMQFTLGPTSMMGRERARWCWSCIAEEELIGSDLGYVSRVAATVHYVK